MKHLSSLVLLSAVLILSTGCKQIEMKNGQIPESFVAQAKGLEGTYKGHVELNDGSGVSQDMRELTLTLKIEGTRPVLTASEDWLGNGCGSTIGELRNVQVSGLQLKRAAFAFDAGTCKSADISDQMMVSLTKMKNGKYMLFAWVMTGFHQIATEVPNATGTAMVPGVESVDSMVHGHFQQQ